MSDRPTVAVIGAGFSGLLTALRLLLSPDGPRVMLIERGPRFGRGAAYSTASPHHLLNVRATNMSALVEQPSHFLDWLGEAGVESPDQVFVTRDRYGQYLQSLLREATADTASGRLALEHDAVVSLTRAGSQWRLGLAMGRAVSADAVVLALGVPPPAAPEGLDPGLADSPLYAPDPWAWTRPAVMPPGEVLLLGTGMTAIDAALTIGAGDDRTRMFALSRHGLLPRAHGEAPPPAPGAAAPSGSPLALLTQTRRAAEQDWRGAVDALRPHIQGIWRGWTVQERRQFLRHGRPWWNVHRHRLAPEIAARVEGFQRDGRLTVAAGRIHGLVQAEGGLELKWTPRGETGIETRRFSLAINCTGPRGDLKGGSDPLLASLFAAGWVRPDACRLGVDVDARSRVIGAAGEALDSLYAVGPLTRGQFYEITSVPDIRLQAADCADSILNRLALEGRPDKARVDAMASADSLAKELATFIDESIATLDVELGSLKFARRVRSAWELRGRRAALGEMALWLDARRAEAKEKS